MNKKVDLDELKDDIKYLRESQEEKDKLEQAKVNGCLGCAGIFIAGTIIIPIIMIAFFG